MNYVPRHVRLYEPVKMDPYPDPVVDLPEPIKIIDDRGGAVEQVQKVVSVPAKEFFSKYSVGDFRLHALLDAGVPLKLINVNLSQSRSIDELDHALRNIDDVSKLIASIEKNKSELDSYFKPVEQSNDYVESSKSE